MNNKETHKSLYFGKVAEIYYSFVNVKTPKQLDQINDWLPGVLIFPRVNSEHKEPEYIDSEHIIDADYDNDCFYSGGTSNRVTQIIGRLVGTARSNQEKGRKDAELIRKHIANLLITDFRYIEKLQNNTEEMLDKIPEDRIQDFHYEVFNYMCDLVDSRNAMSEEERVDESFPFDDYIFEDLIYNVAYQLHLFSYEGLINAFLWLLLGGFLRNQVGSLLKMYHSGFIAINRQLSELGTISDKINYLFNHEEYYSTYDGDDVDSRYPDTTWRCDKCGAILNQQEGFDENLSEWKCKDCGTINKIDLSVIYENEEDYLNNRPVDPKDFKRAVETKEKEIKEYEKDDAEVILQDVIAKLEKTVHRKVTDYAKTDNGYVLVVEVSSDKRGISQPFQNCIYLCDRWGNIEIAPPTYPLEMLGFVHLPVSETTEDDLFNM